MLNQHHREVDFLTVFLAGGRAFFAGVFLLAVLPTIFLMATFFAPVLEAVLEAVFVAVLEVVLLTFSTGALLEAAFFAGAGFASSSGAFCADLRAKPVARLAAPNFT